MAIFVGYVNLIARLEFDLTNYDATVQQVTNYATDTSLVPILKLKI